MHVGNHALLDIHIFVHEVISVCIAMPPLPGPCGQAGQGTQAPEGAQSQPLEMHAPPPPPDPNTCHLIPCFFM